jgi:hypothetical protein
MCFMRTAIISSPFAMSLRGKQAVGRPHARHLSLVRCSSFLRNVPHRRTLGKHNPLQVCRSKDKSEVKEDSPSDEEEEEEVFSNMEVTTAGLKRTRWFALAYCNTYSRMHAYLHTHMHTNNCQNNSVHV